eukprot:CAMPEP_0115889344 /NCGR_PEP_ID=MMETSP0287-20121206/32777_1 /TAXON_ID=412157 /ORGANISM="Chrysochromulina rotalis, Strain UIO044" /LENGTH=69 /DNA_ID=CAMNT_0003346061 /DNA_START=196 /DNA_END=401 /DNA_ORIENTATION=+
MGQTTAGWQYACGPGPRKVDGATRFVPGGAAPRAAEDGRACDHLLKACVGPSVDPAAEHALSGAKRQER